MSDENLAEFFGSGTEDKFYDQMNALTDGEFSQAIQHSRLTDEEIRMYSDYFMISVQMNMPWLETVALNDILLKKSRDGWMVKIKAGILQRVSGMLGSIQDGVGEVSRDIKEAFSGV